MEQEIRDGKGRFKPGRSGNPSGRPLSSKSARARLVTLELCAILAKCKQGDGLSVAGKATVGVYTAKDGTTRPSVSVTANRVMTAAAEGLARPKPKREREHVPYSGSYPPNGPAPFDDAVPF